MIRYDAVVGKKEDWANVVTNVVMIDTPVMGWLPGGPDIAQMEHLYQAESYKAPVLNAHVDGVPVTGATGAGDQRVALRSLAQYGTKAANVSMLTQDLGNQAGVDDELGHEIAKQTKEFSRDTEANVLSTQECQVGVTKTAAYKTRSIINWVQNGAQATFPVDQAVRTSATSISTTATANLTEDVVLNILQSIGTATRSTEAMTCFCGPSAQRVWDNFPIFQPNSNVTTNQGAYPQPMRGGAIDRVIKTYNSPFGSVSLVMSYNNYALDAAPAATLITHSMLFLHQRMWSFSWFKKPTWMRKTYEGGQYEAFMEAVWRIECLNPFGEGRYSPLT